MIGRTDLWSNVVLPKLCGAISCIIRSLKSLFLPKSNWKDYTFFSQFDFCHTQCYSALFLATIICLLVYGIVYPFLCIVSFKTCTKLFTRARLHWNVWLHQMSFEISFIASFETLSFLFSVSLYPTGGKKFVSRNIWWRHKFWCNWALTLSICLDPSQV